jgi:hypothetical protein
MRMPQGNRYRHAGLLAEGGTGTRCDAAAITKPATRGPEKRPLGRPGTSSSTAQQMP